MVTPMHSRTRAAWSLLALVLLAPLLSLVSATPASAQTTPTYEGNISTSSGPVAVGSEVDWSLNTTSTGTGAITGLVITDVLPAGLTAVSLRSGSWTPVAQTATMEMRQSGVWSTVATVDGDDDATYALPSDVEAVRISYTGSVDTTFATTSGARLTTQVDNPPTTGGEPDDIENCGEWTTVN